MIGPAITIAISFAGVVLFGIALLVALLGLGLICIARKGDRPIEFSPRGAGVTFLLIGAIVASNVFTLLVGNALP